jgi:mRNA-degrading endonuclease toxin of MazEF toxin-antitoxin module
MPPSPSSAPVVGDIFLVKFHPGYGSEFKKYRPAVVMTSTNSLIDGRFVTIAPLTTNARTNNPKFELLIKGNPTLAKDSLLLCWYLQTVDSSRIVKKLGKLTQADRARAMEAVRKLLV